MSQQEFSQQLAANLEELRHVYARERPLSRARFEAGKAFLPGSNTRSVLHYAPFPLYASRGTGSRLWDIDGKEYVDFVGEFSAGLYGHSDPAIGSAIRAGLDRGLVLAAPTELELRFAQLLTNRFPSIERVRFCNSGTEANVLALMAARAFTRREKILVFDGAYHGSVLNFPAGGNQMNLPLEFVFAPYNDTQAALEMIEANSDSLAAVIVEPILGAAGNIVGQHEFMHALRDATRKVGSLLIFDEVKTSRCGAGGMQAYFGLAPDLTTLGKYLAGGLACGAFGGRADIMSRFDPAVDGSLKHAGTFNNNVCAMSAGIAALSEVFTPQRADRFLSISEHFRAELNAQCAAQDHGVQFSGYGSIFTIHFTDRVIRSPKDIPAASRPLAQLFHMYCILHGVLVASRGDVFLSLPMEEGDHSALASVFQQFMRRYAGLVALGRSFQ